MSTINVRILYFYIYGKQCDRKDNEGIQTRPTFDAERTCGKDRRHARKHQLLGKRREHPECPRLLEDSGCFRDLDR